MHVCDEALLYQQRDRLQGELLAIIDQALLGVSNASQVDAVHFGYEKAPFTLERVGGTWQLAGKPDA